MTRCLNSGVGWQLQEPDYPVIKPFFVLVFTILVNPARFCSLQSGIHGFFVFSLFLALTYIMVQNQKDHLKFLPCFIIYLFI